MENRDVKIKVFDYIPELDCFKTTPEYDSVAFQLELSDWSPVVWIGRLFANDNDYGEHWFDHHDEREVLEERAKGLGHHDSGHLYIVLPEYFQDGRDGPCNSPEIRKRFWTDVLGSLHLSLDTLFEKARYDNDKRKNRVEYGGSGIIENLEGVIEGIRGDYAKS